LDPPVYDLDAVDQHLSEIEILSSKFNREIDAQLGKLNEAIAKKKTSMFSSDLEKLIDGHELSDIETFFNKNIKIINDSFGNIEIQDNLLKLSQRIFDKSNNSESCALAFQIQCSAKAMVSDQKFIWENLPLPNDILGQFFKGLSYKKEVFTNFSLVNKNWHKIIEQERIKLLNTKMIRFNDIPGLRSVANRINFIKVHGINLQTVFITSQFSRDDFYQLINHIPNISHLSLQGCNWFEDEDILALAQFTNLSNLNLSLCKITDQGLPDLAKLTKLSKLDLSWTDVTDQGLEHLNAVNLSHLSLEGCYKVIDQDLAINKLIKATTSNKSETKGPIFLKGLDGKRKTIYVDFSEMTSGDLIKICEKMIGCRDLRVIYGSNQLRDNNEYLLSDYKIGLESTLDICLRLRGD
jgi:hypothetical protein